MAIQTLWMNGHIYGDIRRTIYFDMTSLVCRRRFDITNDSNWKCPRTLFTTSTRDDRVHPGHARKMVASLLEEAGVEKAPKVLYWENTEGGHGGAADNEQRAFMWALTYNFLARELGLD